MSYETAIDKCIHVGTGLDKNYLEPFHALVASLLENHTDDYFEIHAITEGISDDDKDRIVQLIGTQRHSISFYEVDASLVNRFVTSVQWTSAVYYRLFFGILLRPDIDRLLYLDCDTVVVNSLRPFYNLDLGQFPVGAVYDNYVRTQPHIGIVEEGEYFNSGVLLIDLQKWRRQKISERALEFLSTHAEKILFVDQCALNAVLRNNWKKLESRYNLMYSVLPEHVSKKRLQSMLGDAVVIHFTLQRPWLMLCKNRCRRLYFYYLRRSGRHKWPWLPKYNDFELRKVPGWLLIRLREFYFDRPFIQVIWRSLRIK